MGDDTIMIGDDSDVINVRILDHAKNQMLNDLSTALIPIDPQEVVILSGLKISSGIVKIAAKHKPNNPALWSRCLADAKKRFRVCPSAYCNAFAARTYKKRGGTWKTIKPKKGGK
jgi:hypothetical protein